MKESIFEEYGLDVEPHYELCYCQGDGLSFDCENLLESKRIIKEIKEKLTTKEKATFQKLLNSGYIYRIYTKNDAPHGHCYASKYDVDIELDVPYYKALTQLQEDAIEKVRDVVVDWYLKECEKWERLGYEVIYYIPTFEEFEEEADANGWEFTAEGRLY
jgi:hypothetical protein